MGPELQLFKRSKANNHYCSSALFTHKNRPGLSSLLSGFRSKCNFLIPPFISFYSPFPLLVCPSYWPHAIRSLVIERDAVLLLAGWHKLAVGAAIFTPACADPRISPIERVAHAPRAPVHVKGRAKAECFKRLEE